MTQMTRHPAYLLLSDQLDEIGQKQRMVRLAEGAVKWVGAAAVVTTLASAVSHAFGQGGWTLLVAMLWGIFLLASLALWVGRPMFFRPRLADTARWIETRVDGLHNALTNGLQLARAGDLQDNPWLPPILDEVLSQSRA